MIIMAGHITMPPTLIALELNTFQTKFKNLLGRNSSYKTFIKQTQYCVDTFVEDLLILFKSLLDYTNLFSPNEYEKNDKTILNYFP